MRRTMRKEAAKLGKDLAPREPDGWRNIVAMGLHWHRIALLHPCHDLHRTRMRCKFAIAVGHWRSSEALVDIACELSKISAEYALQLSKGLLITPSAYELAESWKYYSWLEYVTM
jgi:hypothetical protein